MTTEDWGEVQRIINETKIKAILNPQDKSIMVVDLMKIMEQLKEKFNITWKENT